MSSSISHSEPTLLLKTAIHFFEQDSRIVAKPLCFLLNSNLSSSSLPPAVSKAPALNWSAWIHLQSRLWAAMIWQVKTEQVSSKDEWIPYIRLHCWTCNTLQMNETMSFPSGCQNVAVQKKIPLIKTFVLIFKYHKLYWLLTIYLFLFA